MIQHVPAILGHKQVGKTIVVVVAPDATEAVTGPGHSSVIGHVRESTIAVIAIQSVADGDAAIVQVAAVDEINVLPAVAIEVTYADSGPKFLAVNGNPIIAFEMDELDSRRISNVRKLD